MPSALSLSRRIARALLVRWAWRCGTTPERAARVTLAATGAATGLSLLLALWLWSGQHFQGWPGGVGVVPVLVVQGGTLLAMLLTALAQAAAGQPTGLQRSLQPLPIPTRVLAFGLHVPALVVTAVLVAVAGPVGVVVLAGLSGYGFLHAAAVLLHALGLGALLGVLLTAGVRMLTYRRPTLNAYLSTLVLLAWVGYVALSGWRFRTVLLAGTGPDGLLAEAALLWPLGASFALDPRPWVGATALLALLVLAGLVWLALGSSRALGAASAQRLPLHLPFRADAGLPLVRLELARVLRHRRTAAWVLSTVVVLAGGALLVGRSGPAERGALAENLVFVGCLLVAHLPLLARGLSRRHHPYVAVLGFPVGRWAGAVMLASGGLAAVITLPLFALIAVLAERPSLFVTGLGLLVFVVVAASVVGTILTPNEDNAGGELAGALTVFVVTGLSGYVVHTLVGAEDSAPVAVVMAVLALAGAWVPAQIEIRRWRRDTGRDAAPAT